MKEKTQTIIEDTYVAQVLLLAQNIQKEKAINNKTHTSLSGCITEAQALIGTERAQILAHIAGTR